MLDELLLLSGNDIPFTKGQLTIHQPTLKEIGYIGEEAFFMGCQFLNFSKDLLSDEDKTNLTNSSNFDIFMSVMRDTRTMSIQKSRVCALMVLNLIFPNYSIFITNDALIFQENNENKETKNEGKITVDNFEDFKEILVQMFCMKQNDEDNPDYNPQSAAAKAIAEKLMAGRKKVAEYRNEKPQKIAILGRYISILSVGLQMTINDLSQYTVYQLFDQFSRYELKTNFDIYVNEKLAGAKDVDEPDNWMKDMYS